MPLSSSHSENGMTTFQFDETPAIPSYLLAFAIGSFASAEQETFTSALNLGTYLEQLQIKDVFIHYLFKQLTYIEQRRRRGRCRD